MSDPTCPFCGRDPFHYVDNGVGMEAVAVTCCDLGDMFFRGARPDPKTIEMSWEEFRDIGHRLLSTSASERRMREAAVALSKEVDRMWNDPHRFNPPAWESHAKAICSAQQDLSAAIETATIAGDAS